MAIAVLLSLIVTWWAGPSDRAGGNLFGDLRPAWPRPRRLRRVRRRARGHRRAPAAPDAPGHGRDTRHLRRRPAGGGGVAAAGARGSVVPGPGAEPRYHGVRVVGVGPRVFSPCWSGPARMPPWSRRPRISRTPGSTPPGSSTGVAATSPEGSSGTTVRVWAIARRDQPGDSRTVTRRRQCSRPCTTAGPRSTLPPPGEGARSLLPVMSELGWLAIVENTRGQARGQAGRSDR
jgi:hypothetical protein